MVICALFSLALPQLTLGCAGAEPAPAKSAEALRIEKLEQENLRLSDRLAQVERERDAAIAARPRDPLAQHRPSAQLGAPPEEAPGSLPEVDLAAQPPLPGVKIAPAVPLPDEEEPEPRMRPVLRVHGADEAEVGHALEGSDERSKSVSEYEGALALVRQKKFEQGEAALRRFLEQNPDHPYSDNALYWLGESQYARGDYAAAVKTFEAVVSRYPTENKVPDALLKIALSNERLGQDGNAKKAVSRLLENHPGTAAARRVPERYLSK